MKTIYYFGILTILLVISYGFFYPLTDDNFQYDLWLSWAMMFFLGVTVKKIFTKEKVKK
jgi:hypothetical protein